METGFTDKCHGPSHREARLSLCAWRGAAAPDSGLSPTALWLGQLLGSAWLGVAALNWASRATILGGIYGRPIVLANLAIYFTGVLVMLGVARRATLPGAVWSAVALAAVPPPPWLLWRGPLPKDWGERDAT